ncbi:MAG: glycosyltransferase [Prevotella sp.]|nr:glycosyltransferase [Prevotella sp.]
MAGKESVQIKGCIYFYHTRLTRQSYELSKEYKFPGHLLYGLPKLENYGIYSVMYPFKPIPKRLPLMLYATRKILFSSESYDAVYATSFRGIEIIIFLRALGLFHKPIAIWHHTAVSKSKNPIKECISKFFYKGIDRMFFFSEKLIQDSISSRKVPKEKLTLVHWGADLDFYDHLMSKINDEERSGFISTGKENRDVDTLLKAFSSTKEDLDVYIAALNGGINYKQKIQSFSLPQNIHINYTDGVIPLELAKIVARKACVVICCLDFPYTVGLTTLVEAFALGIPVICSKNENFEMDIDPLGVGITVPYGDVKALEKAIAYIAKNPEEAKKMGARGRKLAEEKFNLEVFSKEIAEKLLLLF